MPLQQLYSGLEDPELRFSPTLRRLPLVVAQVGIQDSLYPALRVLPHRRPCCLHVAACLFGKPGRGVFGSYPVQVHFHPPLGDLRRADSLLVILEAYSVAVVG